MVTCPCGDFARNGSHWNYLVAVVIDDVFLDLVIVVIVDAAVVVLVFNIAVVVPFFVAVYIAEL